MLEFEYANEELNTKERYIENNRKPKAHFVTVFQMYQIHWKQQNTETQTPAHRPLSLLFSANEAQVA